MGHNEFCVPRAKDIHKKEICSMTAGDSSTGSEKACAELVRSVLSPISSLLERLIFITSLRDPKTGGYKEWIPALKSYTAEVDRVLGAEHRNIFEDWLCLNLEQQTLELDRHVSNQETPPRAVLGEWTRQKSYQRLIPPDATQTQRELFIRDMATILRILASRDPAQYGSGTTLR
jgi:hypothetical protein